MNVNDKMEIMSKKQIRGYYNMLPKHLPEWVDRELLKLEYPNLFRSMSVRTNCMRMRFSYEFINIMTEMKKPFEWGEDKGWRGREESLLSRLNTN